MDVRGLNFALGETPFDSIKEIIISKNGSSCGTGDSFVNKKIDMKIDVVDMEAYAIAKVCMLENIKFRCFKYISDNADKNANIDWNKNLTLGAKAFSEFINDNSL
jgi:adenosylhomocysteine nucleosidase